MLRTLAFVTLLGLLAGCETYAIRGKVIDGGTSSITLVNKGDDRLAGDGFGGAEVRAILDPDKLSRKDLGTVIAAQDGTFALPVHEVGAGLLEYKVMVVVRYPHCAPAARLMELPPGDKRLLVSLSAGEDKLDLDYNIVDETRQLGEELMRRQ